MTLYNVLCKIGLCFVVLFLGVVLILSVIDAGSVDMSTFQEINELFYHNPAWIVLILAVYAVILFLLVRLFYLHAKTERQKNLRFALSVAFVLLVLTFVSMEWIQHYYYQPIVDQAYVWYMGNDIVNHHGQTDNAAYFIRASHQQKMALFMALIEYFGGNDYRTAFYPLSLLSLLLIVLFCSLLAFRLSGSQKAGTTAAFVTASFLPLTLYTTFVYPTLISLAASLIVMYCVIRLYQTKKKWYLIPEGIFSFLMVFSYSSTVLCAAAVLAVSVLDLIALLRPSGRAERKASRVAVSLAAGLLPMALFLAVSAVSKPIFRELTGIDSTGKSTPRLAWVEMGISSNSDTRKPGSFDGSVVRYIQDAGYDEALAAQRVKEDIAEDVHEYLTGERSLKFFVVKTEYGWTSTWFGALTMVIYPDDAYGMDEMEPILESGLFEIADQILPSIQTFVYLFGLLMAVMFLRRSDRHKRPESLILLIYFAAGFTFQLFYEVDPRYNLPYFTALIPEASIAFETLINRLRSRRAGITESESD